MVSSKQQFSKARDRAVDIYRDDSNQIVQYCNSTTDQLIMILVTAALAFLAIAATSLGNIELIKSLALEQKIIVLSSVVLFAISVVLGIIALICEIYFLRNSCLKRNDVVDALLACKDERDMWVVQETKIKPLQREDKNVGFALIVHQAISFILGIIVTLIYAGTLLFGN